jgi:hypothetical protein
MSGNDTNAKGTTMNATASKTGEWTKHGEWTTMTGPWYRHESGRVAVSGHYGVVGDNMRGWRKTRFYDVLVIDSDKRPTVVRSCRTIAVAKAAAEKIIIG